jgi:hypothetical protein
MNLCFKTYQGWGEDARLRTDPKRHKEAAGSSWNSMWDDIFCAEDDWSSPQQVRYTYQKLMKSFAEELQIGLHSNLVPSGHVPGGGLRSDIKQYSTKTVIIPPGATQKLAQPIVFYRILLEALRTAGSNERIEFSAIQSTRLWQNGSNLRIHFLDGSAEQQDAVRKFSRDWTQHANITFEFRDDPSSEIRITFDSNKGSWSYLGKDCLQIPCDDLTMNLASVDKGTVLHLFGLTLGLMPENQNPEGGLNLNQDSILHDLSICPDYSNPDTVKKFVSKNLDSDQSNGTQFDPDSVMVMPIPNNWTVDMIGRSVNKELSVMDKALVSSLYP